jgi:adenylosuccinate synthase
VVLLAAVADHVIRAQGGGNGGHTVVVGDVEMMLDLVPSGILQPHPRCYLASGVVVDASVLLQEISQVAAAGIDVHGRLYISPRAHLVMPYHKLIDSAMEARKEAATIGTTGRGIGPCYADKASRIGVRVGDILDKQRLSEILRQALDIKNDELTNIFHSQPLIFDDVYAEFCGYGE